MEREEWNQKVIENGSEFLQSWEWGEFQRLQGKRVARVVTPSFQAQLIYEPLPFGRERGYIPRGPVVTGANIEKEEFWQSITGTTTPNTIFIEADPATAVSFLSSNMDIVRQPTKTSVLDLSLDESALYENFHKDLRYSIRRAKKKNVKVRQEDDIDALYTLLVRTARRHGFRTWPRNYYKTMWETLASAGMAELWAAYGDGKLLSISLFILFGDKVTYLHSASDYRYRSYMGSHMLHWQAIQEFKNRGFGAYDFWGINKKEMPGVTRFKKRFGGTTHTYPGIHRRVLNPFWYKLYQLGQTVRGNT